MLNQNYIALIPLLPIITFLIIGLIGRRYFPKFSGILGTLSLLTSFIISAFVAYQYFFEVGKVDGVYQNMERQHLGRWKHYTQPLDSLVERRFLRP